MSVQRRDRPVREYSSAQVTARSVQEVPVSSSNGSYVDSRFNRKGNWEERNTTSLPLKTKPTVYSSGHYVSKPQGNKTGSSGMGPGVCSQQIKPDYLCYNPVHYERERESEIAARIQNVDIRAPSPEPRTDHTKVIPVGVNRTRTSENRRPPPPTRRVSSSIYISPSNPSNLRASTVDSYDPKTYRSSDSPKAPPSISISRPRHKVSYVGNLAQNSRPTTRDRSPSPARSADGMDSDYRARGSYGPRPAQYVPAPPYNPPHQREHLKSYSTSSLSRPWFQSGSTDDSYTNTSRDLRQVPARVITDRPVCEKCRCVPIDRRQRLCAGCQQELYQIHSNTARLYWGLLLHGREEKCNMPQHTMAVCFTMVCFVVKKRKNDPRCKNIYSVASSTQYYSICCMYSSSSPFVLQLIMKCSTRNRRKVRVSEIKT